MSFQDLLPALRLVLTEFDNLGVVYCIGGSVASSFYGEPRSTLDADSVHLTFDTVALGFLNNIAFATRNCGSVLTELALGCSRNTRWKWRVIADQSWLPPTRGRWRGL